MMKKILLLILGLSVLGLDGIAQHGKGNHGKKGKGAPVEAYRGSRGNAYGHDKGRTVVVARNTSYREPVVVSRGPVVYGGTRERVIVYHHRPAVRYVRHVTYAPRPYVYVDINYNRVRTTIVSVEEVDRLVDDMHRTSHDHRRLDMAKDMLTYRMLYAEDVAYIMQNMEYDEHRLEFAKFAFRKTVDKENYKIVKEQLEYRENRHELEHYIDF